MTETLMLIIIFDAAAGHMALAGIYNDLPVLPILYFLYPCQAFQHVLS